MTNLALQIEKLGNDPAVCAGLLKRLETVLAGRSLRFMEVCGTHTVAIFQSGLRSLLPPYVLHISGPGCPVCVTHEAEVALFLELARDKDIILATFGDLMRVPGPGGQSLKHAAANGAQVKIVYSPLDAVALARENPKNLVVFPGIGFETTAPTVAGAILAARQANVGNFAVLSLHKLVPPVLKALLAEDGAIMDGLLLPGHVAMVTGLQPFEFLPAAFGKPAVVGGFEPADILAALCQLAAQLAEGRAEVGNAYGRAVAANGNTRALSLMERVFEPKDALWRGMGSIPRSGLGIRAEFGGFDAMARLGLVMPEAAPIGGCRCGDVLKGVLRPPECPLFGKKCTPATPVGPCMVSTEGSCAAWHKYGDL